MSRALRLRQARIAVVDSLLLAYSAQAANDGSVRLDANETMAIVRELESVQAAVVEDEFPELMARQIIPMDNSIDAGAETFVWYRLIKTGLAEMIANYATLLPNVSACMSKNFAPLESMGIEYFYSTQDLRASRLYGRPLEPTMARLAREAIELRIEDVMALGHAARGITGFFNNADVPIIASGLTKNWDTSGADTILADLKAIEFAIWNQSMHRHKASTFVVGSTMYAALARPYVVGGVLTGESIMTAFLKQSIGVKEILPWIYADLADAQGDGERLVAYTKSPEIVKGALPLEFAQLPPQARALNYVVPCEARIGGVVVQRPLAMAYVDALMD